MGKWAEDFHLQLLVEGAVGSGKKGSRTHLTWKGASKTHHPIFSKEVAPVVKKLFCKATEIFKYVKIGQLGTSGWNTRCC